MPEPGAAFRQGVFRFRRKAELVERQEGQLAAKSPDGLAQLSPIAARPLEQAYGVFREDEEIALRIRSKAALGCRRAEAIERLQSSPVIVEKADLAWGAGELGAADDSLPAGEGILHGSAMR